MKAHSKRKRITVTASVKGIERAEKALIRRGITSKAEFAKVILMGKSTVDKFFSRKSIQLDSFQRICDGLEISDWRSIAEFEGILAPTTRDEENLKDTTSKASISRTISVSERESGDITCEIIIDGELENIETITQETLKTILKIYDGKNIKITDIKSG